MDAHLYFACEQGKSWFLGKRYPYVNLGRPWRRHRIVWRYIFTFHINGQGTDSVSKRALDSGRGISPKKTTSVCSHIFCLYTNVLFRLFTTSTSVCSEGSRSSGSILQIVARILSFNLHLPSRLFQSLRMEVRRSRDRLLIQLKDSTIGQKR